MYTGRYYHKLDDKNRFSLPASFRKNLGKMCVITKGLDGCLFVFDTAKWTKTLGDVSNLEFTKRTNRDFVRLLTNQAEEVQIDTHGRALLSGHLKEQASLQRDIVIVGSLDRVEIWDQTTYHEYIKRIEVNADEIAEAVSTKQEKL